MKRIIISFVAMVLLLLFASPAFSASAIMDEIKNLRASDKQSNDLITHSIIDLVYVPEGTVTTYTYQGNNEKLTTNNFTVKPQTPKSASQLITSFIFDLTNQYRPETEIAMTPAGSDATVHAYTYGKYKDHAMLSIISGLVDCLGNPPVHQDKRSSSWTSKYSPEEMTKEPVTSFVITHTFALDKKAYTVSDSEGNTQTHAMDVEPDLVEGRIFAPVRYVAYAVGVDPDDVGWDPATGTVALAKGETKIQLRLRSHVLHVNGQSVTMDAVPYIKQGRTMLPPRWVGESLGARVDWDAENRQAVITVEQKSL